MVVLTPGPFNSAYFEHSFLARPWASSWSSRPTCSSTTTRCSCAPPTARERVHVIYRRIDDAYLDPEFFRPTACWACPGLMRAYAAGRVALANAPGNGVADDKAIYPYVPDMIRFYLGEEPLLAQVPTYVCARPDDQAYVLEHLHELVVKAVDEAGGYGMLMGPQSSAAEREEFRQRASRPSRARYIAQQRIELSTCPTWDPDTAQLAPAPRRPASLRPHAARTGPGCCRAG